MPSPPTRTALLALLLLIAYAFVANGGVPWAPLAVPLALLGLLFLPGVAVLSWLESPSETGWIEYLGRAVAIGLGVQAAALGIAAWLGEPIFFAAVWVPTAAAVLLLVRMLRPDPPAPAGGAAPAAATTLMLLVVPAAAAWLGAMGPPFEVSSDTLDHVATVRRAALTGDPFPRDALYADPGLAGADPRKGLYHGVLALVVRVTDLDPLVVWRWASLLWAPFLAIGVYALARALTARRGVGVLAAAVALAVHGGGEPLLAWREAVYSTRVSEAAVWLAMASAFDFLRHGGRRYLAVAALLSFAAVATHVFAAVAFGIALGAVLLGLLLTALRSDGPVRRAWVPTLGRWAALAAGFTLVSGPYLVWRYATAYAPADPIHLEPQGLLDWGGERLFSVTPESVWLWQGCSALVLPVLALWLWHVRQRGAGFAYLALVAAGIPLAVLHPMLLPALHDALGYLVSRLVWCVPAAVVLAVAAATAFEARRSSSAAPLVLVLVGLAVAPQLAWSGARAWAWRDLPAQSGLQAIERWRALGMRLQMGALGPMVVAADPASSYALAAITGHHVVTVMPQHASPNDPRGEARLVDARNLLLPSQTPDQAESVLAHYGAAALVLDLAPAPVRIAGPWVRNPAALPAVYEKFASRPDRFRLADHGDDLHVAWPAAGAWRKGAEPLAEPSRASRHPDSLAAALRHHASQPHATVVAAGESLQVESMWSREREVPPGAYVIEGSLVANLPAHDLYRPWYGRVYRRLHQALTGERRAAESTHVPVEGLWPPETWPAGEPIADRFVFPLPADLQPGMYALRLRFRRVPHHPNQRLAAFFRDDAVVWGEPVLRVEVQRPWDDPK